MNFSVEVPGEANPLTPQLLYGALQSATSSQQLSIQTGAQQLQTWETQPGFYSTLQAVYLDKSLPKEVRELAILQIKNGIDKYWRKTATNAIMAEEKAQIRSQLIQSGVHEPDIKLVKHSALVIAKVVRIDYPTDWPDVLTGLIHIIRAANMTDPAALRRGLLILLQLVKELATARLRKSQTSLQAVTPELVFLLDDTYNKNLKLWTDFLGGSGQDEGGAMDAMENSLLALKILRRLLVVGYETPNHDKHVQEIWAISKVVLSQLLSMLSAEPAIVVSPAKELVEKHVLQLSKLHIQMANLHPAAFVLLPESLELLKAYWGLITMFGDSYGSKTQDFSAKTLNGNDRAKYEKPVLEALSLKGLVLFRACIKMAFSPAQSFKYKSPEIKQEQNMATEYIKTQLLTDQLVSEIASIIVTKFFVFRQVDLEAWEEDEDEWETREEGGSDTWEYEIRPCAEKLFVDLIINYKNLLVEPLLAFFQSVAEPTQSSVVTKDAVYTAMGLSAPVVCKSFDFDSFLISTLVNDAQKTGPGYKVLRRRIAILVGQWITIKVSDANRPLVYQIFQHLLNKDDETNDHVVRVTAARQFKAVVDDFSFDADVFLPFAPDIIGRIMELVVEVENTETKMAILNTVRMIAIRLEDSIAPFADQIVSVLPGLWEASGEEHLLKQAILVILSTLVISMRGQAHRYHGMILPLIKRAVEPGSEMQVYLLEEALDLWSAILSQSEAPASAELIELADCAFPLLEIGSDNLRTVLSVVESYVLLAPHAMLADGVRLKVLSCMANTLGVTRRDLAGQVTRVVETMICAANDIGGPNGVGQVAKDLHECGYLGKVFAGLHDAWTVQSMGSGPNRKYPKVDDVVRTDYLTILARIALYDPSVFVNLMSSSGNLPEVWGWLSTEWFRHFDCMANIDRQKLSCLALTRLVELPSPMTPLVLEKLQDYFAMWTQVVGEMLSGRDDNGDNLVWLNKGEVDPGEIPEDARKKIQADNDPIHTVNTLDFIKQRLGGLVAQVGGEEAFQANWAVNIDKDVLEGFQMVSVPRVME